MKKLNKVASLFATAALASSFTGVSAQTVDNWVSGFGLPWKNGDQQLCWRELEVELPRPPWFLDASSLEHLEPSRGRPRRSRSCRKDCDRRCTQRKRCPPGPHWR